MPLTQNHLGVRPGQFTVTSSQQVSESPAPLKVTARSGVVPAFPPPVSVRGVHSSKPQHLSVPCSGIRFI